MGYENLKSEYRALWREMAIRDDKRAEIDRIVDKIVAATDRYKAVEARTGVPWFFIGAVHSLEASLSFKKHLHNGDPLTARTVQVPAGRPATGAPPFTWEDSAIDALMMKNLDEIGAWPLERLGYQGEGYNGWGYRNHHAQVKSPYLWSYSNLYTAGKYVSDGTWSDTAVSKQCGLMPILRMLEERGLIELDFEAMELPPVPLQPAAGGGVIGGGVIGGGGGGMVAGPPPYPGAPVRRGMFDSPLVKLVQGRLNRFGCGPLLEDGDFGEATENAVKLFQARFTDGHGGAMTVDGIVDPQTWSGLFGADAVNLPAALGTLADQVIAIAGSQVGVREVPPGSNRGPEVDQYLRAVGLNPAADSYPWCVAFLYWCFGKAAAKLGVANPLFKTAGVHTLWNKAPAMGHAHVTRAAAVANPALVVPGMVFFIDTGGGKGHAGLVVAQNGGRLETIEGNTNDGGSRDGIGVFRRLSRTIDQMTFGFVQFT